mmetsp:Transcript_43103/g.73530  ORF Transcript_43103/g.73530 Transcript_43103/m.73530 type:complete len:95 (+) Transcript_43103:38-322(+)
MRISCWVGFLGERGTRHSRQQPAAFFISKKMIQKGTFLKKLPVVVGGNIYIEREGISMMCAAPGCEIECLSSLSLLLKELCLSLSLYSVQAIMR